MTGTRKEEAKRWLRQAQSDLEAARWNAQGGFYNIACFLAQQAGEKALKSLLYYLGARRKALLTHSLVEMIREAATKCPAVKEVIEEARELDLHYIPSRYPNGLPGGYPFEFYSERMAGQAIDAANKILSLVEEYYKARGEATTLEP